MSTEDALAKAGAKPAGKRPYFYVPEVERVLAITMAVAQELAVARQRLDTLERILERRGALSADEIEGFAPTPEESVQRALWTQEFLARILRIVQQENEAAASQGDIASEDVGTEIAGD